MPSRVLWLLDNETDDRTFERLCTSLMYRWGYRKIVPIGRTADRGRDAEAEISLGEGRTTERVFFQFTLERRWEPKLRKELDKVQRNGHSISKYVFITRMSVTGAKRDKYLKEVRENYGWSFEVYDREWLRHQLEDANPALVNLYLDPTAYAENGTEPALEVLPPPEAPSAAAVWRQIANGGFESAIPSLRLQLEDASSSIPKDVIWSGLAWCYYSLFNYREALGCIENALALNPKSARHRAIKGCILCEQGSETGVRPLLVSAKAIFQELVVEAVDYGSYYNLGNALSGLGEYQEAVDAYREALNFNDQVAEVWKNLGSCYFHLEEHDRELECYDQALRINPKLSHALASKANTTAAIFNDLDEAIRLLEQAADVDADIGKRWPHFHWWKAHYLSQLSRPGDALTSVEEGLRIHPDSSKLLDLKARILSGLWRKQSTFREAARDFFQFRIDANPAEIPSLLELADLCAEQPSFGDPLRFLAAAFSEVARSFSYTPADLRRIAGSEAHFELARNLAAYESYRRVRPLDPPDGEPPTDDYQGSKYLWLAFGLAFASIARRAPSKTSSADEILAFYLEVREVVREAIGRVALNLATEFQGTDRTKKTEVLSVALVSLAEAAFFESTWLVGYLPAANGVDQEAFTEANEQFIQTNELSPFREDIIDAVLQPLNEAWGLFPEEKNAESDSDSTEES